MLRRPPAKTEPLFGFDLDAFDVVPGWAWWAIGAGAIAVVAVVVRALVG